MNKPIAKQQEPNKREFGKKLELVAKQELIKQGYKIRTLNFQCKLGEIDIIAEHNKTIVFVEVRYRKSNRFGGASASVNRNKQLKLIRTAKLYLQKHHLTEKVPARFDVFAITNETDGLKYNWIKNAFHTQA